MNIEYLDVNIIADRTKYTKTQKQKEELSPLLLFFFLWRDLLRQTNG